jgi:predicted PurR-regulated permease PerM
MQQHVDSGEKGGESIVTIVPLPALPPNLVVDVTTSDGAETRAESSETREEPAKGPVAEWLTNRRLLLIVAGSLFGLLVLAIFAALYFAKSVFFPITLAVVLKLIFGPVVRRLNRWRVPNFAGAALVVCGIFGLFALAVVFLSGPASAWIEDAPTHFQAVKSKLESLKAPMEKMSSAGDEVAALADVEAAEPPIAVEVKQPGMTATVVSTTGEVLVVAFLTLVMLYFLLAGGDRFLEKLVNLAPQWSSKRNIVSLAREIQQSMSSYLLTVTAINIGLGIVIGIGMWLVGMPNPALWGAMAALLNYIPYFGAVVGMSIVFLVGLISFDSVGQALWGPAIYYIANVLEGNFVTPLVMGRSISLSPLAIVVSLILWGWLWGISGMILAVPILVATKIACDHIAPLEPVGRLLGR